ncbi:Quinone oxidoreductase 2 [Serratia ficaria]|uniref:SDR family oxidoreductase n=1 Tax=Serratia ficaria TaxID=61651 RepID=UPI00218360EB|nr:SDR family oxidoreductase [Serratia ficaria]CAI2536230.1 Quinone oxidoreductase 2 [Serratia ficaria]
MKIAITGSTGKLGHLVINKLKEKLAPSQIIALARTPEKADAFGVTVRKFDYTKPEELVDSLKDVDTLLLISANEIGNRAIQHKNVIDAAVKSGVKHIVYTSFLYADSSPLNLAPEHVQTELDIKNSGIDYTILRNGWYSENYTDSIKTALQLGAFYGCAGNGKISSAPKKDYAEAAVIALTQDGHKGKTYELAGDDFYTLTNLSEEITKQSGKEIPYCNLSEDDYSSALKKAGLPKDFADAIASWDTGASKDALFNDERNLSKLIGRKTTPISDCVKEALSDI